MTIETDEKKNTQERLVMACRRTENGIDVFFDEWTTQEELDIILKCVLQHLETLKGESPVYH